METSITKKTKWECQHCGKCCKGLIISKDKSLSVNKDGEMVCKYLDTETKLCKNYNERPFICRVYPFIVNFNLAMPDSKGISRPQRAFKLENMKIHSDCTGYGKGKRVLANKNLQKKFDALGLKFAVELKERVKAGKGVSDII